jgi:hypothetical protein
MASPSANAGIEKYPPATNMAMGIKTRETIKGGENILL